LTDHQRVVGQPLCSLFFFYLKKKKNKRFERK
jgi:hypothetical protein